jgi:hypothetical protein
VQRGWERVVVRYPLIVLVAQGRLRQREAAMELGLSERQVRRLVKRYRESDGQLGSLAYQRRHPAWNALPDDAREEILRYHNLLTLRPAPVLYTDNDSKFRLTRYQREPLLHLSPRDAGRPGRDRGGAGAAGAGRPTPCPATRSWLPSRCTSSTRASACGCGMAVSSSPSSRTSTSGGCATRRSSRSS